MTPSLHPATSPPGEPMACVHCGAPVDISQNFCASCGNSTLGDALPDPLVGQVVADRYKIMQLIGRGGMGVVYKCEHTRMGKVMAIKLLHGELARDPEIQRRFRREAQAASRLSHPCTVSIFDFGTSEGLMYLVMEFVSGEDLGRVLRGTNVMPSTRIAAIAAQACGSLAEAHENGIVHRDLKPENLLISRTKDQRDLVKLLDFGLAKLREGEDRNEVTSSGTLVGTPYYMAPEIIRGLAVDHRVDIYALGAVLYRAVTGTPPFTGTSPVAVLTKHLTDDVIPPSRRRPELGIPPAIDAVVMRCMEKDPANRYAQIDEVREKLTEFLASEGLADSLLRASGLTARNSAMGNDSKRSLASPKLAVATRNDVEAFERRLRRGRLAVWGVGASIVIAGGVVGSLLWHAQATRAHRPRETELEPNNTPETATLIAPDTDVRGRIGARLAVNRGDVDFYQLAPMPLGPSQIRVELNPQPNVSTIVELLRVGQPTALAVADDGAALCEPTSAGRRQVIAGFRVMSGSTYYLSVHEHACPLTVPMENVTDVYTLHYAVRPIRADVETEPNDNEEIAARITAPGTFTGYVESRDDVDYWCFDALTAPVSVTVTPPPGLDVALVVHRRDGAADTPVDTGRAGRPEHATVQPPQGSGLPPCIVVREPEASPPGALGDPDHPYTLTVDRP